MIAKLLQRLKGELALALMRTFIAKGIAAVGGIVLFIVLGRLYGAVGVGVFALAQSIYLGAGILARYGMDNALMRYVGQDPTASLVPVYLRWALTKSALLSTVAAILVFLLRDRFALWLDAPMLGIVLSGIALAIPPFTVAFVLAGFMKGIRKPATACLLENGGIALVATLLVLLFDRISTAGIVMAGWAMAAAAWLVLGQGLRQTWKWRRSALLETCEQTFDPEPFKSSSNAFFLMSLAPFMEQVVFVMIAGFYLGDVELGLFKGAERLALSMSFIYFVMNTVIPPRFAKLYEQKDINGLLILARRASLVSLVLVSPLLVIFFVAPQKVLSLYGSGFSEASSMLRIIVFAHAVNVVTGSVGYILSMTGHEKDTRNTILVGSALGIALLLFLTSRYGPIGAAYAIATTMVSQKLAQLFFVKKRLGIWVIPKV